MGGRQSTNTSHTANIQTNSNSANCAANANAISVANNASNGTNARTSFSRHQINSSSNASASNSSSTDWRQRARSLSSVLNGSQSQSNGAIGVPQGHSSFGLSTSPDSDTSTDDGLSFSRVFSAHSLPVQLVSFNGIKCPVCSKLVLPDDVECHLVMCLTKPRINYNEDTLTEDKECECVICLEELIQGDTIARLPCLCIYHKCCIDAWFEVNRSCPEHPSD